MIPIKHVVLLMLENRSFDSLLGWLYEPLNESDDSSDGGLGTAPGPAASTLASTANSSVSVTPHSMELKASPDIATATSSGVGGDAFGAAAAGSAAAGATAPAHYVRIYDAALSKNSEWHFRGLAFPCGSESDSEAEWPTVRVDPARLDFLSGPTTTADDGMRISTYSNERSGTRVASKCPVMDPQDLTDDQFRHWAYWPPLNPGEEHNHTVTQLYGGYPWSQSPPDMTGFATDYVNVTAACRATTYSDAAAAQDIMTSVHPAFLPTLHALAKAYAVSDSWFSSVPSQTWANRLFAFCGTSRGIVVNKPMEKNLDHLLKFPVRTFMAHFDEWCDVIPRPPGGSSSTAAAAAAIPPAWSWRVYSHRPGLDTMSLLFGGLFSDAAFRTEHCAHFETLARDAKGEGGRSLPKLSIIEPAYMAYKHPDTGKVHLHNDHHPAEIIDELRGAMHLPPVWEADRLVLNVYNALFGFDPASDTDAQLERRNATLLIITYDEHGGNYDHVRPPKACHPHHCGQRDVGTEFNFDRLGVRVPAVFVSPQIMPGTILRPATGPANGTASGLRMSGFDHTSIIASLRAWLNASRPDMTVPHLTRRDAEAPTFWHVVTGRDQNPERFNTITGRSLNADVPFEPQLVEALTKKLDYLDGRIHKPEKRNLSLPTSVKALRRYATGLAQDILKHTVAAAAPGVRWAKFGWGTAPQLPSETIRGRFAALVTSGAALGEPFSMLTTVLLCVSA